MKSLFRTLLAEAKRVNPAAAATLRPGLSLQVVKKKLATLPYEITSDAASLYECADGAVGPFELLPGGYFIPLQKAMKDFKIFHQIAQDMDEEEDPQTRGAIEQWLQGLATSFRRMIRIRCARTCF